MTPLDNSLAKVTCHKTKFSWSAIATSHPTQKLAENNSCYMHDSNFNNHVPKIMQMS